MAQTLAPASSFGEELHQALREGSQKRLVLTFDSAILARRFRNRINHLRVALKKEKHPNWEALYRCGIYINHENDKQLILAPKDSEFRDVLAKAGVSDAPLPTQEFQIETPPPGTDPADSFLGDLAEATRIPKKPDSL